MVPRGERGRRTGKMGEKEQETPECSYRMHKSQARRVEHNKTARDTIMQGMGTEGRYTAVSTA